MNILVVDDDPNIRDVICFALKKSGYQYRIATDGAKAMEQVTNHTFDLIVLDIGLPEMDGLEVCRQLRKTSEVPILFLSARDEEIDRVLGLEMGGDDYVTKPFSPRELVARIKAILKRSSKRQMNEDDEPAHLQHGLLAIDIERREISFDQTSIDTTAKEFALLLSFTKRPGMVFSRDQLMDAAYDHSVFVSDRTIDSHVRNIRAKLLVAGCDNAIETLHGVGFRLGKCERISINHDDTKLK